MDQEKLKAIGDKDLIKNELVKEFTKHIEEDLVENDVVKVKLVVLGPQNSGKTCWVNRLINDDFSPTESPTLGAKFSTQGVAIEETEYRFDIWDVSGEDWCRSLCPMYLQHANAAVICYDPSDVESYKKAKEWVEYVKGLGDRELIISLVGMKHDLASVGSFPVKEEEVERFFLLDQGGEREFFFPNVSAKSNELVQDVVLNIAEAFYERGVKEKRASVLQPDVEFDKVVSTAQKNQNGFENTNTKAKPDDKVKQCKSKMMVFSSAMGKASSKAAKATKKGAKRTYDSTRVRSSQVATTLNRNSQKLGKSMRQKTRRLINKNKDNTGTTVEEVNVSKAVTATNI